MTDHVIIDAGTLEFSEADLTATGLLIPYGVPARSNLGTFTFESGDIELPEDLTGMSLNVEHKRERVVGAFTRLWEQPEGVMATFKYRATAAGRKAFEDGKTGKLRHLSAEVSEVRIHAGRALPGAEIFAGAQVERPAFEGATLLAAEDTEQLAIDQQEVAVEGDPEHPVLAVESMPIDVRVVDASGTDALYTPEAAPAEDNPENKGTTMTATAVDAAGDVTAPAVPATLLASQPANGLQVTNEPVDAITNAYELGTIFASMALIKNGNRGPVDRDAMERAQTLLAALSDIKVNTTGGLTTAASGVIQPAWVGKLWQGKTFARKYIDLVTHLFGGISIGGRKGFTIDQGTALVQHWDGNKAAIGSGTATTATKASTRRGYGYAADIAREFWDLDGGEEVIEAFLKGVVDSYARITDADALADILGAASGSVSASGVITADKSRIEDPGTDYPAEYSEAMGMVIDGIDLVTDADDDPGFVLVNRVAWRQLRFTPKDQVPEYIKFAVKGTGEGDADNVIVKRAPDAAFDAAGFNNTDPAVVAGARTAIEFREQGEVPIQLEALDIARGGVDKAVIGYLETFVVRPEALIALGTPKA